MKLFITILSLLVLSACSKTKESTSSYNLPAEMKDCRIFWVASDDGVSGLTIVRCGNTVTETHTKTVGKTTSTVRTVTINGEEYQKVDK